jgi:hypothetical protein
MTRVTTRLCTQPGCRVILVDAVAGARCPEHQDNGWAKWRETPNGRARMGSYGPRWRRVRNEYLRTHPTCEELR